MNDLLGQVVKSVTWGSKKRITETIRRRFTEGKGSHTFIRGDLAALEALIANISPAQIDYEFVAVQPGLRKAGLPEEISHMMASASDYLIRGGFKPLKFQSS